MLNLIANIKVGTKIYSVLGMLLFSILAVGGAGIYQMSNIGKELHTITTEDIPLTNMLTSVTIHQLEQTILLERAFAIGAQLSTDPSEKSHFIKVEEEFIKMGHKVENEIHDAVVLLEETIKIESNAEVIANFKHLLSLLVKVEAEHKQFETLAEETLKKIEQGDMSNLKSAIATIEGQADKIDHELTEALTEVKTFTENALKTVEAHEQAGLLQIIIISGLAIVIGTIIGIIIVRGTVGPIVKMTDAMGNLADGDLKVEIPAQDRKDEVGKMAGAVQIFKETAIQTKKLEDEVEEQKKRAEEEKRQAMHTLASDFESSVGGIINTVSSAATELQSSAHAMSSTAEETTRQSGAVAAASEQASTNVQTVASAAEELSASITEIRRQVTQSQTISTDGVKEAERANEMVQGLVASADKIGAVVSLITDIAEQTNLLALNATIEAARAGESGKGFAVVANEVKSLANQTAKATDEISQQINDIQSATKGSVDAITTISSTIVSISDIASEIAKAVEEQGAATQEITRNVSQASAGTTEVSTNIQGVNMAAAETGAAATQITQASGELSQQSEMLKSKMDDFLDQVRTA